MSARLRELLGPGGRLSKRMPGWEARQGQLQMAEAVEDALAHGRVLLTEAGTGTGKTLAYLVPAIESGQKVLVSTATRALQDQIAEKDLPLIEEHLGLLPRAAILKGLPNYLCLRRFHELRRAEGALAHRSLPMLERWARETETGEVSELSSVREGDPLWRAVMSSSETRLGPRCEHFEACFVTRAKRAAEEARLVVVNHYLFFADLAVRRDAARRGFPGAAVLPAFDAVVFDEAHQLEEIATSFFGTSVSLTAIDALLRDAQRALIAAGLLEGVMGTGKGAGLPLVVETAAFGLFEALREELGRGGEPDGRVPLPEHLLDGTLRVPMQALVDSLGAMGAYLEANTASESLRVVAGRASRLQADLVGLAADRPDVVRWVERRGRSLKLGASPIELGPMLRAEVFERVGPAVLTSATLGTGFRPVVRPPTSSPPLEDPAGRSDDEADEAPPAPPRFSYLRSRLGLDEPLSGVPVVELEVPSPFDFPASALLYVARDLPDPSEHGFGRASAHRAVALARASGGGAFVLATSLRSMESLAAALRAGQPRRVFVQGEAPKLSVLSQFQRDGDAVLVATMSFWEGIDVPGRALRLVVLDKIPFAVPTDPVIVARGRALEAKGRSPFTEYGLPQAAITLRQGFGRLVRSKEDRGVVAVLDGRLLRKPYGRRLLDALPPARRTESLEDVELFFASM